MHNEFSYDLILILVVWLSYVAHVRTPQFLLSQPASNSQIIAVFSRAYYTVQGTKTCFFAGRHHSEKRYCFRLLRSARIKRITWLFEGIINIQGQMISRVWALIIQVNKSSKSLHMLIQEVIKDSTHSCELNKTYRKKCLKSSTNNRYIKKLSVGECTWCFQHRISK